MTIIENEVDLIGKEDIAFGDSSQTWDRKGYTGTTVPVHYIDASVIPAPTSLGGFIGDHLHAQNTDTSTTASSYVIGSKLELSSSGLTAKRTFTFPDSGNQQLVGSNDLASTSNSKGASLVGLEDSGSYYSSDNIEDALQEVGYSIYTLESSTFNRGMKIGFKLGYSSSDTITIGGGIWAHAGTTNQHVKLTSQITFTLGPSGSNSASSNLGANEIHYIYIDDSAVVALASSTLTENEFLNSTIAPTYNHAKVGFYNGNDRCIGAIRTDDSGNILQFSVFGDNFYRYASPLAEFTTAAAPVAYSSLDVSSSVPRFATRVRIRITNVTGGTSLFFDTSSTSVTPEAYTMDSANKAYTFDVPTNNTQSIYWYASAANNVDIDVVGYYMDEL